MSGGAFDRDFWEGRWAQALSAGAVGRPPNAHLLAVAEELAPGMALDAGCGHGTEAIWLAAHGWTVTAVDFSATALEAARARAGTMADRISWVEGDLASWTPPAAGFDLVSCLYVHVSGSVAELVARLGSGVAAGGTLLLVGHLPVDPDTGEPTPAAGQVQVTVEGALAALEPAVWDIIVAEERRRADGLGADAVVRATRR